MIKNNTGITLKHLYDAKNYAFNLLGKLDDSLIYHKREFTTDLVYSSSLEIARLENLSLEEKIQLGIAASFYNTNFLKTVIPNKLISAKFAQDYMDVSICKYSQKDRNIILNSIIGNTEGSKLVLLFSKILQDANNSVLGLENFVELNLDLMKESQFYEDSIFHEISHNKERWFTYIFPFFSKEHDWLTQGARKLYQEMKEKNL